MRERCYNPNYSNYKNYGGRGITVCDEWSSEFEVFQKWALSNGYQDNLTIDRIDNNQGYCPANCRWTTHKEQANNKRNTIFLEVNGIKKALSEWAEDARISREELYSLWKKGFRGQELFGVVAQ